MFNSTFITTSAMSDQAGEYNVNNTPVLEDAFNAGGIKEEHQEDDFVDDKVDISEIAIVKNNTELQAHLLSDKTKHHDKCTSWDNIKTQLSLLKVQHDGIKVEEGDSADDIRIKFNNGLLYCEDCHVHFEEYCAECDMLVHILNRTPLINDENRSQEELPHGDILEIRDYFGEFHVFALKVIPAGVKFGPFVGLDRTEHPWKIKGGKFVINKDKSKHLNWMQYINPARNISEQNLQVFQYEHNLYYRSTRRIQEADELLVCFGEEYEDSLIRNVEMDFVPRIEHIFKEAFACTFCCLGFSSKLHLAKHKTICPRNAAGGFSIEDLTQCPSCKIHLDRKEYSTYHMAYCCEKNDRKSIRPTPANRASQAIGRKTLPRHIYKCQQCKYKTKYKGDLKNHINQHYEVKTCKCGICFRQFKTKEVLRLHVENAHICADGKDDLKHYMNAHLKPKYACVKQFKCSLCEFRTKYKRSLKMHLETKHLKEFKYKCDACDYKANQMGNFKRHIETIHLKEFKYKCDSCDYKTNRKDNLKTHIDRTHLKVLRYKCGTCDYKTNEKCDLKLHIERKHLNAFKYKCDTCDFKTSYKASLKTHIGIKHSKKLVYKCDRCDYKTNYKSEIKEHIDSKHLKKFKHECEMCDYKTNRKSHFQRHVEGKHTKEIQYKCDTCDYKTKWKCHLKRHIDARHSDARHLKQNKYKCDRCDYKASQGSHLKSHIEEKHLNLFKYACDRCDYKAKQQSRLKSHIEAKHLREFKYKCELCDYKANQNVQLKIHIKTKHLKEFKYKCETCDFKSYFKGNLKAHVETKHLKEFKYKCQTCDYKANQKVQLKTHIETKHLKDFKHKCDSCDFKSYFKGNLKTHIETKHLKEFKYKCDTCDYKTNWQTNLRKHIDTKHLKK